MLSDISLAADFKEYSILATVSRADSDKAILEFSAWLIILNIFSVCIPFDVNPFLNSDLAKSTTCWVVCPNLLFSITEGSLAGRNGLSLTTSSLTLKALSLILPDSAVFLNCLTATSPVYFIPFRVPIKPFTPPTSIPPAVKLSANKPNLFFIADNSAGSSKSI